MITPLSKEDKRLNRLFERYNRHYWYGRLPACQVTAVPLESELGLFDPRDYTIKIDLSKHESLSKLRRTMLHEMAHAAAEQHGSKGHDVKFFEQLERLLQKGAPIGIDSPDAGRAQILKGIVPTRFPLLKRKMERVEARRSAAVEHETRIKNLTPIIMTDDDIIAEFKEAAMQLTWKRALIAVGIQYGLVDEVGRPVSPWARRFLARARTAHRNSRRAWNRHRLLPGAENGSVGRP
jgi:hypothetical protein